MCCSCEGLLLLLDNIMVRYNSVHICVLTTGGERKILLLRGSNYEE